MIQIQNLHKRFGTQVVLDGITLDIAENKITTVVGPSGVGKSVLLKLIMGILQPEEGQVLINGENITAASTEAEKNDIRASLGVLFQSAALFDSLSVYENIAFPLIERFRMKREQAHEKVSYLIRSLSLEKFAKSFPQEISLGIRKRVGLARALTMEPKIVLFDEPNTGLDPLVGQEVYDLIKDTHQNWGYTGIVISHELPEVFQVSDKLVMLLDGKVRLEGTPQDFIDSDDPAVAQFIKGKIDGPIRIK